MNQTDMSSGSEENTTKERLCDVETVETNDYSTRPNVLKRACSNQGKSKINADQTGKCQGETSYF